MTEKTWKHTERRIAELLGGERVPVTGRARGDVPDIRHDWLCPEVKHRKLLPAWLLEAMAQARAAAHPGQLSVAVLHKHGAKHSDDLLVLRLSDFLEWFGGLAPNQLEQQTKGETRK